MFRDWKEMGLANSALRNEPKECANNTAVLQRCDYLSGVKSRRQ